LATGPSTTDSLDRLVARTTTPPDLPLGREVIDPRAGLTPVDVAILAVLNDPDLNAKRAAAGVAAAQTFAARLLPDPQVSLSADIPGPNQFVGPGQPAATAYGITPSLDIAGLIAHAPALHAAKATERQAHLDLLWAEWGVAQQARALAEIVLAEEARLPALDAFAQAAESEAQSARDASARGSISAAQAATDEGVRVDAQSQLTAARQVAARARLDLNALLGLKPTTRLLLRETPADRSWDRGALERARASLATRRPDLLALQAGYESQQANLRRAVLAQFPLLNVGLSRAMDNTGIASTGPQATLTLPVFGTARGPVAVEAATRDQLRAEYQARLDQSDADVAAEMSTLSAAREQIAILQGALPRLKDLAQSAKVAFARGDIDGPTYVTAAQTYAARVSDLADRDLAARLSEITLEGALFLPPAPVEARP
jgi:outer membrane protein TolC